MKPSAGRVYNLKKDSFHSSCQLFREKLEKEIFSGPSDVFRRKNFPHEIMTSSNFAKSEILRPKISFFSIISIEKRKIA